MTTTPERPPAETSPIPAIARVEEPPYCPAAAPGAAAVRAKRHNPPALAALLAGHILRDGEVVLLILKPSFWFIVLTSLKFAAAMAILAMAAELWLPARFAWIYVESAIFLVAGRLMWATLHWMGRLYVLTDQRVLRLAGVFSVDISDLPLRKIRDVRLIRNVRERLFRIGTLEIIPRDDRKLPSYWQMVPRPADVLETVMRAVRKARRGSGE